MNGVFAGEKVEQVEEARRWREGLERRVAEGSVERLVDGRYRVLSGWDRGELLSERGEPLHGLDMTLGRAALYSAVPAWHGLGRVVPGGISDIDEVLALGGIDFAVELAPALYRWGGDLRTKPDTYHTVRTDTGTSLGVVGSNYTPIQNRTAFEFLQELVNDFKVPWESAGAVRGGRRVFVSMRLPKNVTVDAEGINDQIVPFIAAINSHDGSSAFQVVVTPWRPVCGNTERFAVRDAHTRWSVRHTTNAAQRIHEARRTLQLSVKYYDQWAEEETTLARTGILLDEFDDLITSLWPLEPDASGRKRTNHARRSERLHALFATETGRVGRTAYAAERAVTDYLDHHKTLRPGAEFARNAATARATYLLEGTDDEVKNRTHKRLMLLRRR